MDLYFVSKWEKDKKKTWSGTNWSIYSALSKHYQMHDIDLPNTKKSLLDKVLDRLLNRNSNDIGLGTILAGRRLCQKQVFQYPGPKIIFQFAEFVENTPPLHMQT
jgi:hypothetical protein